MTQLKWIFVKDSEITVFLNLSYQVSEVSRLEVGFREELLDAGDADGAGAAPGHVVVLLQAAGAVVQGSAFIERVSQSWEFVDCHESNQECVDFLYFKLFHF